MDASAILLDKHSRQQNKTKKYCNIKHVDL